MRRELAADRINCERYGFWADVIRTLEGMGHTMNQIGGEGVAEVIMVGEDGVLESGVDRRAPNGSAAGWQNARGGHSGARGGFPPPCRAAADGTGCAAAGLSGTDRWWRRRPCKVLLYPGAHPGAGRPP